MKYIAKYDTKLQKDIELKIYISDAGEVYTKSERHNVGGCSCVSTAGGKWEKQSMYRCTVQQWLDSIGAVKSDFPGKPRI